MAQAHRRFLIALFVLIVPPTLLAASSRVQYRLDVSLASGTSWGCKSITVPAGQRLLITELNADVRLPSGQRAIIFVAAAPDTAAPPSGVQYHFPLVAVGTNISAASTMLSFVLNAQPEIWSDRNVDVCLSRGPNQNVPSGAAAIIGVSGRLITLPE